MEKFRTAWLVPIVLVAAIALVLLFQAAVGERSASAQTSSVTLTNATAENTENPTAAQVIVNVQTVDNCDPGNRAPLRNGTFTLDAGANDVTGVLSQNCNWDVTFRSGDGLCAVSAQVKGDSNPADANSAVDDSLGTEADGSLILLGYGGNSPLRYSGGEVASVEFTVSATCTSSPVSESPAVDTTRENITVDPAAVPASAGSYTVRVTGMGWLGAPDGLFITACSGAEGGDSANINAGNLLGVCPTLIVDTGRGNPSGGDSFTYDLLATVDETAIANGSIAILAGELANGSPWFAGTNLRVEEALVGPLLPEINDEVNNENENLGLGSSITLSNVTATNAENPTATQIIVSIQTVSNCNPGEQAPLQNGVFTLNAGTQNATGVLSPYCNWQVTFLSADSLCAVSAEVKGDSNPTDATSVLDDSLGTESDGSLLLLGLGSNGSLLYNEGAVYSIDFTVSSTCQSDPTATTDSMPTQSGTTFVPDVRISVPQTDADGNGVNDFTGTSFLVRFSGWGDGDCSSSTYASYVVANNGLISGVAPSLVDVPAGESRQCQYTTWFPRLVLASSDQGLFFGLDVLESVSAGSSTASANYVAVATFEPIVRISVPQTDDNGDGINDFAGTRFSVDFLRTNETETRCVTTGDGTYMVADDGSVSGSGPSLVDVPAGETSPCQYRISLRSTVGTNGGIRLALETGASELVSATSRTASASYVVLAVVEPDVRISVPQTDADGDGVNDFAGAEFRVRYWKTATSDSKCTLFSFGGRYVVANNGSVGLHNNDSVPALVDMPVGKSSSCEYRVEFPPIPRQLSPTSGRGLFLEVGASSLVSAESSSVLANYVMVTTFAPDVRISVPQTDADADGVNDFTGTDFWVYFQIPAGSDVRCMGVDGNASTSGPSRVGLYVVSDDGSVGLREDDPGPVLVNMPPGASSRCEYQVSFPSFSSVSLSGGFVPEPGGQYLGLESGATESVSAVSSLASASYVVAPTFEPDVRISVPQQDTDNNGVNDFAGSKFWVSFDRMPGASVKCSGFYGYNSSNSSSISYWYVVADDGSVGLQFESSGPVLVDVPVGESGRCRYEVSFPNPVRVSGSSHLGLTSASNVLVSAMSGVAFASYTTASTFESNVRISVPQVDANTDGKNDFAGITFQVNFQKTVDSHSKCTSRDTVVYKIANDGSVGLRYIPSGPVLVDVPVGESSPCKYKVSFPNAVAATGDMHLGLESGASELVSASSKIALAGYSVVNTFIPTVMISVPMIDINNDGVNDFASTEFLVVFRRTLGSASRCTSRVSVWYAVANDGSVGLRMNSSEPSLVDMPVGESSSCEYRPSFPGLKLVSGGKGLLLESGATVSVSAMSMLASANYEAVTVFEPQVTVEVPQLDIDGDGVNDFAGTEFRVSFRKKEGSDARCTSFDSVRLVVANDGSVGLRGNESQPVLVDMLSDVSIGCDYSVSFSNRVQLSFSEFLVLESGGTESVNAGSTSALANYTLMLESRSASISLSPIFVPAVAGTYTVTVSGIGWQGVVSANGLPITVCSNAQDGDANTLTASNVWQACPTLATDGGRGNPSGGDTFSYDLSISVSERDITNGRIAILAGTRLGSGNSYVAIANLIVGSNFTPQVSVGVPQYFGDSNMDNAFTGVVFTVEFNSSATGCTSSATETYEVGNSGTVRRTSPSASLVTVFEGSASECSYAVAFSSPAVPDRLVQSSASATVSANTRAVRATYVNARTAFTPDPTITSVAGATDTLTVSYSSVATGCTTSASETYEITSNGDVRLSGDPASLVDRPEGVVTRCVYTAVFPFRTLLNRLELGVSALTRVSAVDTASASYAVYVPPPPPQNNVGSNPSVGSPSGSGSGGGGVGAGAGGSGSGGGGGGAGAGAGSAVVSGPERQPVSVTLRVPVRTGQGYGSAEAFRVRVFAPGACGGDTSLFGGVSARLGVTYSVRAVVGDQVVIGTGAAQTSPGATYTIPEYEQVGSLQVDCVLRIAEVSSPDGCALRTTTQDSTGTSYVEISEADNFETTLEYDCAVQETEREMSRGWTILRFNGQTGTTPATFAASLSNSVNSIWVWDPQTQGWNGWSDSGRVATLAQLNQGDLVMAYVPRTRTIAYSPPDLLNPPAATGSLTLPPLYSVQMFGGQTTAKLSELLTASVGVVPVIFRWNSQSQEWNYHLPGYGPVPSVSVPWFDEISPGDTVFIFNATGQDTTIAWS